MSGFEARALVCGYENRAVVRDVSLKFDPGSVTALLGPNGSGKSTLLKTIAGLLPPLGGDVVLSDNSIRKLDPGRISRLVAWVPQTEHHAFGFSAREVVMMGRYSRTQGLQDTHQDHEVVAEAMRTTDCWHIANRPITELSGGEKQRVLLARALAQDTPFMVLDEPTTHLDPKHVSDHIETLGKLKESGKAVGLAIHDVNLALRVADQICLLAEGRVRFLGNADEFVKSEEPDLVYQIRFQRVSTGGRTLLIDPNFLAS